MSAGLRVDGCPLCDGDGGRIVWQDAEWRVVAVDDAAFPGFYRVLSQAHVVEFSDLDPAARKRCMQLVATVEQGLRERLSPTKVNLAALGNVVPHLHWHVVARFDWDSHFPQPIWGQAQRDVVPSAGERLQAALRGLDDFMAKALNAACAPAN